MRFGEEPAVQEALGLDHIGRVWATRPDDEVSGSAQIVGWSPRNNFDDLTHAIVTTFSVLTLDNWNLVLENAVASQGPIAVIYFYLLITIGTWSDPAPDTLNPTV
ncbi:hypothetical protein T484DRAFT_2645040 [Baffinella frigidus]|nr:hypothetical protein T484DRAFT_2645040 [Cryptophyta sp. CCMP2293]